LAENDEKIADKIRSIVGDRGEVHLKGKRRIYIKTSKDVLLKVIKDVIDNMGETYVSAITGVELEDTIRVYYHLWNIRFKILLSFIIDLNKEAPEAPSLTSVIPGAMFHENEAYDLLGIKFTGHPNLHKHFLLPEDTPSDFFPLRSNFKGGEK